MRIPKRFPLLNFSGTKDVRRLLVKRYFEQSDSSPNGLNTLIVIVALAVGIPTFIFIANKYNIFGGCSDSYESDQYRRRIKRKRRYRSKRPRVDWYISPEEEDESDEESDYHSREYEKHKLKRYKKKSSQSQPNLTQNKKSRTSEGKIDLESKGEENQLNQVSAQSNKSQTSMNSEYRYCVYNPHSNRMAMSRSVDDLQSAIPSDSTVIYKVDDHHEVEKFENHPSMFSELTPSANSNRSVYYIVNSNLLLSQLRENSENSVDSSFLTKSENISTTVLSSDPNYEHTSEASDQNYAQPETSTDLMSDDDETSVKRRRGSSLKTKKRKSSSRVRIIEPLESERYSRRDKRSHRSSRRTASRSSKSKRRKSRRSSRTYRSKHRVSRNY